MIRFLSLRHMFYEHLLANIFDISVILSCLTKLLTNFTVGIVGFTHTNTFIIHAQGELTHCVVVSGA